jgi:phosphatidylglycerophosphate synthase
VSRWAAQYRQMLKAPELEEPLDLAVYRPLAFGLVKAIARTGITPNQITMGSLVPGLASAWCFWQGRPHLYVVGAGLLFLANVLDCADGMLARLKGTGCLTGYILDGLADYTIQVTLIICLLHGLAVQTGDAWFSWVIGVPAGVSFAWWCARVDRFRNEWLERVYGRRRDLRQELHDLQAQAAVWRAEGSHRCERALVSFYAVYVWVWYSAPAWLRTPPSNEPLATWRRRREPIMRLAVLMGPTMHLSLIMVAGVLGHPQWYIWTALVFGTSWGVLILAATAASDHLAGRGGPRASRTAGRRTGNAPASAD